jgi:hypothetical protein
LELLLLFATGRQQSGSRGSSLRSNGKTEHPGT